MSKVQEYLKDYLRADCTPEQVLDVALRLIDRTSEAILVDEFPDELSMMYQPHTEGEETDDYEDEDYDEEDAD